MSLYVIYDENFLCIELDSGCKNMGMLQAINKMAFLILQLLV